jgi:hypothetical protein
LITGAALPTDAKIVAQSSEAWVSRGIVSRKLKNTKNGSYLVARAGTTILAKLTNNPKPAIMKE